MGALTFRCGKCRVVGRPWKATGRSRDQRTHFGAATAYEYRCRCGQVGWTIHLSVKNRAEAHADPEEEE